jgi:hypothetical protein
VRRATHDPNEGRPISRLHRLVPTSRSFGRASSLLLAVSRCRRGAPTSRSVPSGERDRRAIAGPGRFRPRSPTRGTACISTLWRRATPPVPALRSRCGPRSEWLPAHRASHHATRTDQSRGNLRFHFSARSTVVEWDSDGGAAKPALSGASTWLPGKRRGGRGGWRQGAGEPRGQQAGTRRERRIRPQTDRSSERQPKRASKLDLKQEATPRPMDQPRCAKRPVRFIWTLTAARQANATSGRMRAITRTCSQLAQHRGLCSGGDDLRSQRPAASGADCSAARSAVSGRSDRPATGPSLCSHCGTLSP